MDSEGWGGGGKGFYSGLGAGWRLGRTKEAEARTPHAANAVVHERSKGRNIIWK